MDQPTLTQLRIAAARAGLADTLDQLERKATTAAEGVLGDVKETVEKVCDTVGDSAANVSATIHEFTSGANHLIHLPTLIRSKLSDHPWASVGAALLAGVVAGVLPQSASKPTSTGPKTPWWKPLADMARRELMSLGEVAIASGVNSLKDTLMESMYRAQPPVQHSGNGYHQPAV